MLIEDLHRGINHHLTSLRGLDPTLENEADTLAAELTKAPRIVIVGRLKAGKSTLVNALIGAPVSETAALEATNTVTIFENGAPERAEILAKDGTRTPITTRRGEPITLTQDASTITHITRWIPSSALDHYTLIDTPGLATLTTANEETTRRALLDEGWEQTKDASVNADATVFLFDSVPRKDEVDFLHQLGFTPLNTLGLLSRADSFGEGALGNTDPLDHATTYANVLGGNLSNHVLTVKPVAGLLAESAATGRITETLAKKLGSLSTYTHTQLITHLTTQPNPELEELINIVGEYGFFHGRTTATQGATALQEWLNHASNLADIRSYLTDTLAPYGCLHRAGRIVSRIEELAYAYPQHAAGIRSIVTAVRNDPRLTQALLLHDLKSLMDIDADEDIIAEVIRVISGRSHGQKLGLDRFASGHDIIEACRERTQWAQNQSMNFLSAAEEAALFNLRKAYAELEKAGQALT